MSVLSYYKTNLMKNISYVHIIYIYNVFTTRQFLYDISISDLFNYYSANINGMLNAQKLGGKYKIFELTLTYKIHVYV